MAEQLVGCYQHVTSENLEEFLETMDIPGPMRTMMANTEPKVTLLSTSTDYKVSQNNVHTLLEPAEHWGIFWDIL